MNTASEQDFYDSDRSTVATTRLAYLWPAFIAIGLVVGLIAQFA